MQRLPEEDLRALFRATPDQDPLDHSTALRPRNKEAEEFRTQLTIGIPNNADEAGLRRLAGQLRTGNLVVRLFLRPLHAKLYLSFRNDPNNLVTGYRGSRNLTLAGLSHQGELNVDVLDHDASTNLRQLAERYPLYGDLGFYDAVDPKTGQVAYNYLALNQSMILIVVVNHMRDGIIQQCFAADPIIQRVLPLLEAERFFE